MGCPCTMDSSSTRPDTNATRDQRLVPPQRQKDGIRAAEAEHGPQAVGDSACGGQVHVRSWRSVSQTLQTLQCWCWLLPQAATALTRNRPSSFPPPALGQAFAGSANFKQLGRPAVFLCFALLCFAWSFLIFPSLSCSWRTTTTNDDTQLNHERTLGGSRRRSQSIQSINPSRNLNSKPAAKRDKSRTASIVGDRVLGHE